jgi:hypothetical protein
MRFAIAVIVGVLAFGVTGCGSTTTTTTTAVSASAAQAGNVAVSVTSPTSGTVIAGRSVTIRGTVTPTDASVLVQGKPAAVGNGVFTAEATLHGGKTTIDVIGSAPGATPGSTSVSVTQQSSGGSGKNSTPGTSTTPASPAPQAPTTTSAGSSCGGELSVGPDTSCAFAEAVESAYRSSGDEETVEAYSPVTHKAYEMTCVQRTVVECTGGIGATVYFP